MSQRHYEPDLAFLIESEVHTLSRRQVLVDTYRSMVRLVRGPCSVGLVAGALPSYPESLTLTRFHVLVVEERRSRAWSCCPNSSGVFQLIQLCRRRGCGTFRCIRIWGWTSDADGAALAVQGNVEHRGPEQFHHCVIDGVTE